MQHQTSKMHSIHYGPAIGSNMNLPEDFTLNINATYGEAGKIWLQQLDAHLEHLSTHWNCRFLRTVSNLSYSFVGLVELNTNHQIAVLKTAPSGSSIIAEANWLKNFKKGVPNIFDVYQERYAFLMERLEPGTSLKSLVKKEQDEAATRIIAQTILDLQFEKKELSLFQSCKHLTELAISLSFLENHVEKYLLSKAESLFRDLSADCTEDVLLHGDLHHDNILQSGSAWKVIDPHGYIGDPIAEVGPMIRNPNDCFPTDKPVAKVVERRLKILIETLPFDAKRIQAWTFCLTMLSAAWDIEGFGKVTGNTLEIARAIDKIKL